MARYFDKTFFKFLFGFVIIIAASLAFMALVQRYDASAKPDPDINIANP